MQPWGEISKAVINGQKQKKERTPEGSAQEAGAPNAGALESDEEKFPEPLEIIRSEIAFHQSIVTSDANLNGFGIGNLV